MIRQLSDEVKTRIRTGVALTSFSQAVEELVLNAIDAKATSIGVRVDLPCNKIQVVDNGFGITPEQLPSIGERYHTSKCHRIADLNELKYYGYRGEALASLRSVSTTLEIVSKPRLSNVVYRKLFLDGKLSYSGISAELRASQGTTITASNMFYNLPVRRKRMNDCLELEQVRFRVAGIAMNWPKITISLRDDNTGNVILQTRKCADTMSVFSMVFTPARARALSNIYLEKDEFIFSGLLSRESYSRPDLQFVFVNKRLVLKSSIHKQINKILGRSLILKKKKEIYEPGVVNSSPTKLSDRYGVYVLNITCPFNVYDITFDPRKTLIEFTDWPKVIHLLQDLLYGFLRKENLLSVSEPLLPVSPYDVQQFMDHYESEIPRNRKVENPIFVEESEEIFKPSDSRETKVNLSDRVYKTLREPKFNSCTDLPRRSEFYCGLPSTSKHSAPFDRQTKSSYSQEVDNKHNESTVNSSIEQKIAHKRISDKKISIRDAEDPLPSKQSRTHPELKTATRSCSSSLRKISVGDAVPCSSALTKFRKSIAPSVSNNHNDYTSTLGKLRKTARKLKKKLGDPYKTPTVNGEKEINPGKQLISDVDRAEEIHLSMSAKPIDHDLEESNSKNSIDVHQNSNKNRIKPPECFAEIDQLHSVQKQSVRHNVPTNSHITGNGTPSSTISVGCDKPLGRNSAKMDAVDSDSCTDISNHSNFESNELKRPSIIEPPTNSSKLAKLMRGEKISNFNDSSFENSAISFNQKRMLNAFKFKSDEKSNKNYSNLSENSNIQCKHCDKINNINESNNAGSNYASSHLPFKSYESKSTVLNNEIKSPTLSLVLTVSLDTGKISPSCDPETEQINKTESNPDHALEFKSQGFSLSNDCNKNIESTEEESSSLCGNSQEKRHLSDQIESSSTLVSKNKTLFKYNSPCVSEGFPSPSLNTAACNSSHCDSKNNKETKESDLENIEAAKLRSFVDFDKNLSEKSNQCIQNPGEDSGNINSCNKTVLEIHAEIEESSEESSLEPEAIILAYDSLLYPSVVPETEIFDELQLSQENSENCEINNYEMRRSQTQNSSKNPKEIFSQIAQDIEKANKILERTEGIVESFKSFNCPKDEVSSTSSSDSYFPCAQPDKLSTHSQILSSFPISNESSNLPLLNYGISTINKPKETADIFQPTVSSQDINTFSSTIAINTYSSSNSNTNLFYLQNRNDTHTKIEKDELDLSRDLNKAWRVFHSQDIADSFTHNTDYDLKLDNGRSPKTAYCYQSKKQSDFTNDRSQASVGEISTPMNLNRVCKEIEFTDQVGVKSCNDFTPNTTENNRQWTKCNHPSSGKEMFVNSLSGHSITGSQWSKLNVATLGHDHTTDKPSRMCLPSDINKLQESAGRAQEFNSEDFTKWRDDKEALSVKDSPVSISKLLEKWNNPVFKKFKEPSVVAEGCPSDSAARSCYNALTSLGFTKEMLCRTRVLGQLDNKFIVCTITSTHSQKLGAGHLVLFDQHAVHERIRLEQLTADIFDSCENDKNGKIKSSEIKPIFEISLDQDDVRVINAFSSEFRRIGIYFETDTSKRDFIKVWKIPQCVSERETSESKAIRNARARDTTEVLIKEHVNLLKSTNGACGNVPLTIHKILCSQACHGAVKFGDPLTVIECEQLLKSLRSCQLPFQCAHGRPSVVPLVDLTELDSLTKAEKPRLYNITQHLQQ